MIAAVVIAFDPLALELVEGVELPGVVALEGAGVSL